MAGIISRSEFQQYDFSVNANKIFNTQKIYFENKTIKTMFKERRRRRKRRYEPVAQRRDHRPTTTGRLFTPGQTQRARAHTVCTFRDGPRTHAPLYLYTSGLSGLRSHTPTTVVVIIIIVFRYYIIRVRVVYEIHRSSLTIAICQCWVSYF